MAKRDLLPDESVKRFTVPTRLLRTRETATLDGRSANELDDLYVTITYTGEIRRRDAQFTLLLEWVDLDEHGHRVLLPHDVLTRIVNVHDRIMDEAKSERAKRSMRTRMDNGYVPTFGKREEAG